NDRQLALPDRHRGILLVARGGGVDAELRPQRRAVAGVLPGVDAPAVAVLVTALPGDGGPPVGVQGDRGGHLVVRGGHVDAELAAQGVARGVVAPGVDAPAAAVLVAALPGDDEVAPGVHGDRGAGLVARGGRVDAEVTAPGGARGVVALGVAAPAAAVLVGTLPGGDEVARGVHGDRGAGLVARGGGVDAELPAQGVARRVVAPGVDAPATAVRVAALP